VVTDDWCQANCYAEIDPQCPPSMCDCSPPTPPSPPPSPTPAPTPGPSPAPCRAITSTVTDDWCEANCHAEHDPSCPAGFCDCSPPTPPTPPAPPTPPPVCPNDIVDGWFFAPWAGSSSGTAPLSVCIGIYFWGVHPNQWQDYVNQNVTFYLAKNLLPGPMPYKVLNVGSGDTSWDDATIQSTVDFLPTLVALGFNGVAIDAEVFPSIPSYFTMSKFLGMFKEAKRLGLLTILTSTAEGPYFGCDSPNDCWKDIKWDDIDYMVPQVYGASGVNYNDTLFDQYANFWKVGGGQGVHGSFPGPSDRTKVLWSVNPGTGRSHYENYNFAGGYIEWAFGSLGHAIV